MKSYYDILEIKAGASADEIKQAYRRLAMKYHPDRNQNNKSSEEKFKSIKEAYEALTSPDYKYVPDAVPVQPAQQKYSHPDLVKGKNIVPDAVISVTLENIETGVLARASKKTICPACSGTGKRGVVPDRFGFINLMGRRYEDEESKNNNKCFSCSTGEVIEFDCYFDIPKGAPNGAMFKLQCLNSDKSAKNSKTKIIKVVELKHPQFDRLGNDLYASKSIEPKELKEGCRLTYMSLNNKKLVITVPPNLENKSTLKLKGCGLPDLQTREPGNLYLTLKSL